MNAPNTEIKQLCSFLGTGGYKNPLKIEDWIMNNAF